MTYPNEDLEERVVVREWLSFGAGGAGLAPLIEIISPTVDTTLAATTTPLVFRVWERGTALRRSLLVVEFPGMRLWEVAHNGEEFTEAYRATSTRTAVTDGTNGDGYEYALLRSPQWPDAPTLHPFVTNTDGLENA